MPPITLLELLRYNQRIIVYPHGFNITGERRYVENPRHHGMDYEDVELHTKDNVTLRCYLISKTNARGIVIIFHGNAMNHGETLDSARKFFNAMFSVFTLEYRGYGYSDGVPSESGLRLDAQAAVDYVLSNPTLSRLPIIIYGQSVGGGVAVDVTSRNSDKIRVLIIENTFTSLPNVVKDMPVIGWFYFLSTQRWPSAAKLAVLPPSLPILMLSGSQDTLIQPHHMKTLWDIASTRGKPKTGIFDTRYLCVSAGNASEKEEYTPPQQDLFKEFPYGTHNNTYLQSGYWDTVFKFLDAVLG